MLKKTQITLIQLLIVIFSLIVNADEPITTDSRIKTYVYNENEVYPLVIFFGYQTSIELAKGEELTSISLGDSYAWNVSPVGRRVFIKPLEENMHTNMTLLTNKRAYQFDLFSKKPEATFDKELVYVMRFYYPEKNDTSDDDLAVEEAQQ